MRRRSPPLGLILLFATLAPVARAEHGTDPVSRKVSRSLREPTLQTRAATPVEASEPWRQGSRVHANASTISCRISG